MITNQRTENACGSPSGRSGFGLVELVVSITVLMILGAILIPVYAGVRDNAEFRRCQRIAQEYATLANAANSAGCVQLRDAHSVAEAMEMLGIGVHGTGLFEDLIFQLPNVATSERNMAAHHLAIENGLLTYNPVEPDDL